jgi:hypothetical protein
MNRVPSVAAQAAGGFVVAWEKDGGSSVQARRYDSGGSALGSELQVGLASGSPAPGVAADADGDFAVVWGGDFDSVLARFYASDGTPLGAEVQVNPPTTLGQFHPSVAAEVGGGFVAVWSSGTGPTDIRGQRFGSDGAPAGAGFQVSTYTTGSRSDSDVAPTADGTFVATWASQGSSGTDPDTSIQGQRFTTPACSDAMDNDGDTLIDFPSDPGCASASDLTEKRRSCGLGFELTLVLPVLLARTRRRHRR